MNPSLITRLKEYGLLPRDMDPEGEAEFQRLKESGLAVEKPETHYSPGMPEEEIRAYESIGSALGLLRELQKKGESNTPAYQDIERLIEENLEIIPRPGSFRMIFSHVDAMTGVVGVNRDC